MSVKPEQQIDDFKRASTLMDVALDLDDDKRKVWLAELYTTDPRIAATVEQLLDAHMRAARVAFLDQTITPESLDAPTLPAGASTHGRRRDECCLACRTRLPQFCSAGCH
jgi:hypothetical protein